MKIKTTFSLALLVLSVSALGQELKPGFDKDEYKQMMLISAKTSALDSNYYNSFPNPENYKLEYRSPSVGFDNLWEFWTDDNNGKAVISVRGTTEKG